MDKGTLAQLTYNQAMKDLFGGKGRIIINEFTQTIPLPEGEKPITAQEIIDAFKEAYPQFPIEQRTQNIILIDFGTSSETP